MEDLLSVPRLLRQQPELTTAKRVLTEGGRESGFMSA